MDANVYPVAGGFHAQMHLTGRTITVFGRTSEEARAALEEAQVRAIEADRKVRERREANS